MNHVGPYINTELYTTVTLYPDQMNNMIYINLKKNLEDKILHKCFDGYGYIMEIFKITKYDNGIIPPENMTAAAVYNINFTCRLCSPLKNSQIVCEVARINRILLTAKNGPIIVIITKDKINNEIYFNDNNNNLRYRKDNKSYILKSNDHVVVNIIRTTFNRNDTNIKAIGFLSRMATADEIAQYYRDLYNKEDKHINFEEYTKIDNT